ncbi:ABC transporter ATP-binding protein [Pontivivens nitratireducens]|uniref:ABC transporter ATP-binding protein n=1 Tax=Pontivivens nitratireducens TaxID=2758038 RepID=A0A6G7VLB9_9RHOB|nr:ABC transporter ATP-binding protein [Pontibrevibacter nitratireducens]QIK40700.1 ABC transporter ATP-binding protein [Pontibrevibacter nitratireducens]
MSLLTLTDLKSFRRDRIVLDGISLHIAAGEVVGLIGRNGAGKTTLMRAALGLIPFSGYSSLMQMGPRLRARHVAWLPQSREIAWPISVEALVALGRLPHEDTDPAPVTAALHRMDLEALRHRPATELSGGEQARVLIARTLAQQAPLLMADEPVAGLDPAHQIATMQVLGDLARGGHGVLVSIHDLGLAVRHCTRLIALDQGRIAADGPPREVLTPALLHRVFGITAHFEETPQGPIFQPLGTV